VLCLVAVAATWCGVASNGPTGERGGRSENVTTTTLVLPPPPAGDESPRLAATLDPAVSVAQALTGVAPVPGDFTSVFPNWKHYAPTTYPWRHAFEIASPSQNKNPCTRQHLPVLTMTGLAERIVGTEPGGIMVWLRHYAFEDSSDAGRFFTGRVVGVGVDPGNCAFSGKRLTTFSQHVVSPGAKPSWADQWASFDFTTQLEQVQNTTLARWSFVFLTGREIWELGFKPDPGAVERSRALIPQLVAGIGSAVEAEATQPGAVRATTH
jgi:hypothetical protein